MAPTLFRIRVKGCLGPEWSAWFDGMSVARQPDGNTVLSGPVCDQAALYGLLIKVRDLGLVLVGIDSGEAGEPRRCRCAGL